MTLLTAWGEIEETERRARLRALRVLIRVLGGGAAAMPNQKDASGKVVVFATADFEKMLSLSPSMTLALNSMEPGHAQRGHRHNSAAVTLVIEGQRCYSMIDGDRGYSGSHANIALLAFRLFFTRRASL
jgi:gentisate 1,2-dioxygenase